MPLMIMQQWFDAKEQDIYWTNIYQEPWRHMWSLDHTGQPYVTNQQYFCDSLSIPGKNLTIFKGHFHVISQFQIAIANAML